MRAQLSGPSSLSSCLRARKIPNGSQVIWRRSLQITSQSADAININHADPAPTLSGAAPDARFEVLGSPFSLLSVFLSASQNLYTRRGSLVGLGGKPENAISTLSMLEPFRRAPLRIPFFYQRISSTSPITALISTKAANTSMTTVNLDGTTDWMLVGRSLLAWTGQTLHITPTVNTKMSLAYWGGSQVTGRGLLALAGRGSISQVALRDGESYVVHPSNVIAYTINPTPPLPYRLKSFNLQIPNLGVSRLLPDTRFIRAMRGSYTWQTIARIMFDVQTWARRSVWGDRLFLQFHGPTKILLQTRAARISDVLTSQDVNEFADAQPGVVQPVVTLSQEKPTSATGQDKAKMPVTIKAPKMSTASIGSDGKVTFEPIGGP